MKQRNVPDLMAPNSGSYVYVLLAEGLRVLPHHVGQVPLPDVELLHLLLDELRAQLLSRGRRVLPAGGGAHTDPPVENLESEPGREHGSGAGARGSRRAGG